MKPRLVLRPGSGRSVMPPMLVQVHKKHLDDQAVEGSESGRNGEPARGKAPGVRQVGATNAVMADGAPAKHESSRETGSSWLRRACMAGIERGVHPTPTTIRPRSESSRRIAAAWALVPTFAAAWWGMSAMEPTYQLWAVGVLWVIAVAFSFYVARGGRWPSL